MLVLPQPFAPIITLTRPKSRVKSTIDLKFRILILLIITAARFLLENLTNDAKVQNVLKYLISQEKSTPIYRIITPF